MSTESSQQILNKLLNLDQDVRNNILINTAVKTTVGQILNSIDDPNIQLKANNVKIVEKYDNKDIEEQKDVRNKGQLWSNDIRADLELIDKKTNKVIDKVNNMKIADIPKLTDRGTFLIGGNEYQFIKQARLKPGVYTKYQKNGEISSFFNVDKTIDFARGFNNNFKIEFDPERKIFSMAYGTKHVPLINALRSVGITDKELINSWGQDVFDINSMAYTRQQDVNQKKFYEAVFGKQPAKDLNPLNVSEQIKTRLFATKLDPDVTQITLGKPYTNVNKDAILDASKKIIDINRGVVDSDDREALVFKSFYDVEDHIKENLIKNAGKIVNNIKFKLNRNRSINKSLSPQTFNAYTIGTITNSQLSSPPNQTNPMAIIGEGTKFTVMGEGGIGSANAVTNEARQISNSEVGFVDPLHTPEGGNIGIAVHTSYDTIKVGNDLYSKFMKPNGEYVLLRPIDVHNKNVAFPDQFQFNNMGDKKPNPISDKIKIVRAGKLGEVKKGDVDYIIASPMGMFDTSANSIPFLDSIQGNRGLTASKMQEQAISLKNREKPLFKIINDKGKPFGEELASLIAIPKSPIDGEVKKITPNKITLSDKSGKEYVIPVYHNFSLNSESYLHNEPLVKVGDKVKVNDILADNNFTKDGQMALGANLHVAYMPYKGYNYEDSAIMSESAAKKLTSQHIYDLKTKRTSKGVFSANKYKAYYPEELTSENMKKLDKEGVILPGQTVKRDDIVIAHLERKSPTADDIAIGRLDKQLKRDMADNAIRWDNDHIGTVTDVKKSGNSVVVSVKTEEPLKVADKISGLHGNKHIIAKIVPDNEMPFNPTTGKNIDLTMSPIGVSNRINTSQLLESAAGKIAWKTGQQYPIRNFSPEDNSRKILQDMKEAGVSDKDILIDPDTKQPYKNPVATGFAHILKLEHKIDHKYSARYRDEYDSNEQPASGGETGGKNIGRMETAALLARGAKENLREMFSIKGQRNDEYWKAMETGQTLPPPNKAFVWDKLLANMQGSGINVQQKGKNFILKPLTDKDILERSRGELLNPTETYRLKDMAPIKEGLFDPVKAGGIFGDHFTHFSLPEKTLNPIAANAAANLLDMPLIKLEGVITGKQFINKKTGQLVSPGTPDSISGGPALETMLGAIDVNETLDQATEALKNERNSTKIDKLNKKIKYLRALKEHKMKPADYLVSNVLVTPSKYRPVIPMAGDGAIIMSDINDLYQQTAHTANALKDLKSQLDKSIPNEDIKNLQLAEARGQLYNDLKSVTGLQAPTSYLNRIKNKKGFVEQIAGSNQSKEGFFQDKVLERRQDLVGRSTIILNPDLGGDQMGIPKEMASKIFRPFIMKKMVSWGYTPLEAQKQIEDKTSVAERARDVVADERLIIANRAPSLHRWNMTAFKPILTEGKSIEVPGVVVSKNFGGDFDGDSGLESVFVIVNFNIIKHEIKNEKIIHFGGDFDRNKLNNLHEKYLAQFLSNKYIYYNPIKYLSERIVSMPTLNRLIINDSEKIIHINIEDFPRIEGTQRLTNSNNIEYEVPKGIKIITIDNKTKQIISVPVSHFSIHPNLNSCIITMSDKNSLILSDDHSAVYLNTNTWNLEKISPKQIVGKQIPKVKQLNIEESVTHILLNNYSKRNKMSINCVDSVELTKEFGYFLGIMIGNGSTSGKKIDIATIHQDIENSFKSNIIKLLKTEPTFWSNEYKKKICNSKNEYIGKNISLSNISLAENLRNIIGHNCYNKHLPPCYMSSPKEFKLGLLSGMLDTDGSIGFSNSNGSFKFRYATTSLRLADEILTMCKSLNISCLISYYSKNNNSYYNIGMSSIDIRGKELIFKNKEKSLIYRKFLSSSMATNRTINMVDRVPWNKDLYDKCEKFIKDPIMRDSMRKACRKGLLGRLMSKKIISMSNNCLPSEWIEIVNNNTITWLTADKVNFIDKKQCLYDITVPGPMTFMCSNGIPVFDTFQLHVPISPKAIAEAEKMKPSASMLKTGYDSVLNVPQMDMIVGSWLVSKGKGGQDTGLKFDTLEQARNAFKQNKFTYADSVTVGDKKAPFGMHEINSVVPDDLKKYDIELNGKNVESWIRDVTKKHNGKIALGLADKIKDVGNNYSTIFGFTLGVSDTVVDRDLRDSLVREAEKNSDKKDPMSIVKAFSSMTMKGRKELENKYGENTMIGVGLKSGGTKGIDNISAIALMPGIVTDAEDRPIPLPITKSYSEGLDTFGYWSAAHGARGGNIKKSISSSKPGWLTKDLINSIYETRITHDEPVDNKGFEYDINDNKGILNRFLAQDAKADNGKIIAKRNDIVTSDVANKLSQHGIKKVYVQSPITDPTPGDGFSSFSYGVNYDGKKPNIGDNIGIISAHTITEPSLNMAMKAFHTGGALQIQKKPGSTVFDQLFDTLRFTKNNPDKATLASIDGVVKDIKKSPIGGWDVHLDNGEKQEIRYIDANNQPLVKPGVLVKSGDLLSTGTPSAHDILKYKGMPETQKFLVNHINELMEGKLDKRDIETVVRGLTNTTRILEPGSHPNYLKGDVAPLTTVEHYNNNNLKEESIYDTEGDHLAQNYGPFKANTKIDESVINKLDERGFKRIKVFKDRIKHEPFLTPTGIQAKAQSSEDWIARLAHNRIAKVLEEGTTQSWKSISNPLNHPIPEYVTGNYTW